MVRDTELCLLRRIRRSWVLESGLQELGPMAKGRYGERGEGWEGRLKRGATNDFVFDNCAELAMFPRRQKIP